MSLGVGVLPLAQDAQPFEWTATADSILKKVAMLNRDYKKLVASNQK